MKPSILLFLVTSFVVFSTGCTTTIPPLITANISTSAASPTPSPSVTPSSTSTPVLPSNIKSLKVIFKAGTGAGGSFDAPPAAGTLNASGSGHVPKRIYYPDNTLLASQGPGSTGWPSWLKNFEIGVSGSNNVASPYAFCARFAEQSENSGKNCRIGRTTPYIDANCGVPSGQFRVSEADCTLGSPGIGGGAASSGNGGGSDGVYVRAIFDRTMLGANENILINLEYAVGSLNPPSSNPRDCFNTQNGVLTPESCTDFVWKIYLKNSPTDTAQPFLLLIPPTFYSILGNADSLINPASGVGITTKQFILPLAAHPNVTTMQLSRVSSHFPSLPDLLTHCTSGSPPGNSPLCSGLVIYSMTFFRI